MRGLALAAITWALVACDGERLLADPGTSFRLDSGVFLRDTGVDVGFPDSGPAPDARVGRDASVPPDSGPPAARCECPALPASCGSSTDDGPAFSPGGTRFQSFLFDRLVCAENRLRIAIYEADWDCIVSALNEVLARNPGLELELLIDDDRCPLVGGPGGVRGCELSRLQANPRVTIVDDARSRYMHHKFMVVDDKELWVSSANFTRQSFCSDDNDALRIRDPGIVSAYGAEFDRLMTTRNFGPRTPAEPTRAGPYSVYFGPTSPIDEAAPWFKALVAAVDDAESTIEVLTFAWTRPELAQAMVRAAARGVDVRAVVSSQYADEAAAQALVMAGIPVRTDNIHSKWIVIDRALVVTGSANWSENAWANNENSLWVRDPAIAARYLVRFEQVWATARAR